MLAANFKPAMEVVNQIQLAGFKAYIVGGAIRDYLLNKPVNDIDIATSASPTEIQSIFDQVIPVGIEHGTVIVRHLKQSFEVTTFRSEQGYSDYRRPDRVEFVDSIETDLSRRDFTINAMAMTSEGMFIDPFDGQEDLKKRLIRAVGEPIQRLTEDPLRMLRAIRFVSQLEFQLDPLTWQEIKSNASLIEKLSIERITIEIEKLFQGEAVEKALEYGYKANLFNFLPIFKHHPQLVERILLIKKPITSIIVLFCYLTLTTDANLTIHKWCQGYRLSNKEKNNGNLLYDLVKIYQHDELSDWLVYLLPDKLMKEFILLIELVFNKLIDSNQIKTLQNKLPIKNRDQIQFNGHDILALYPDQRQGSWIKDYLLKIERQIVEGHLNNDYEHIKEWILNWHPPKKT